MENREQQILSEIKSMMASIRSQLEILDTKIAELQQVIDPVEFEVEPVDLEIDVEEVVEEIVEVQEIPMEAPAEEPVAEPETEPVAEDDDDLPFAEIPTMALKAAEAAKPTVNEMMSSGCAWRRDMPGAQVKDVRSAISLNDRVIFINLLFNEDAQGFVDALTKINSMENLDQVVEFVTGAFPEWDMDSELVYRFMMAVRRKVR